MTKLSKILLTSMSIPAVATPLVTLTSCSQAWGYKTPFMIGSISEGPYETMMDAVDADGNPMDYLQNQYAIQSSNNTFYAYSTPYKFDTEKNEWVTAESGWYQSTDTAFASTATDKDGKQVTCTRNATLANNVNFVSTIGNSVNAYLSYALQYQAQQVSTDNEDNLKIAWGGAAAKPFTLNHGSKEDTDPTQNNDFFEYIFASANINGKEKSSALLRPSNVDFNFSIKMPIPNYFFGSTRSLSAPFKYLIEANPESDLKEPKYSTSVSEQTIEEENDDGVKVKHLYKTYVYDAVPIIIQPTSITQTYLNPSKKDDSFLVNDYYSTSREITESIGDGWKEMLPKLTKKAKEECVPSWQTYRINTTIDESQIDIPYGSITNRDGRLNLFGIEPSESVIVGSSFIGLVGYSVRVCYDETGTTRIPEKDTASITGIQNFFPSYFIDLYKDQLFKKIKDDSDVYVFDQSKINDINSKFLELIRRTGGQGYESDLSKLNDESKNLLSFLGYMFGSKDHTINTLKFLHPQDPIK